LVFLVDDDELYLDTLEHNLRLDFKNGVKLEKFSTAEDCLKNIHRDPDIVLLDYYLPGSKKNMNGIEVLRKIKENKPDSEVVMLSGYNKLDIAVNCIRNGAYDYIVKNESAYMRAGNLVKNLLNTIQTRKESRTHEKINWVVGVVMVMMVMYGVYFHLRYD
ncbi:MAG: response regulator, partial [Bacteroidia bacterium]